MKAILLSLNDGTVTVEDVPSPRPSLGTVLVRNYFSLISAGTERARMESGKESLMGKARHRPEQARLVLESVKELGPAATWRFVSDRLKTPVLTGYSSAGIALEVGGRVDDIRPGQLVACAGAGFANHAELIVVPRNLCATVPSGVMAEQAAFGALGAIALHGIHQLSLEPGSRVAVIGLGLVGQLTLQILVGYGYQAVGIDRDHKMVALANDRGAPAFERSVPDLPRRIQHALGGGADGVIVTAASRSSDPVEVAGSLARDRAIIVIVGDVAVTPARPSYYGKELTIRYSRSYGPGRYDSLYEEAGIDYPDGYVPWDERRNLQEVLRLMSIDQIDIAALRPKVFPVERATEAFALLTAKGGERPVATLLDYGGQESGTGLGRVSASELDGVDFDSATGWPRNRSDGKVRIAAIGAGSFARRTLLPPLARHPDVEFSWIASANGVTARYLGKRWGFERAVSDIQDGLVASDADAAIVATRHDSHGEYTARLLSSGLGVFCEKPLALTEDELESIAAAWNRTRAPIMVGFNRRFAPAVEELKRALQAQPGRIQISCRVFAGRLRSDHWLLQPEQGGRVLGEVCHFVDLANWLAGEPAVAVLGKGIDSNDPLKAQTVTAMLDYANGSVASIIYGGSTPSGAPKELIEVAGDGIAARIDNFSSLEIWGQKRRRIRYRRRPKGHSEEIDAFIGLLRSGVGSLGSEFVSSLWSSLATIRLATAIQTGLRTDVSPSSPALAAALGAKLIDSAPLGATAPEAAFTLDPPL